MHILKWTIVLFAFWLLLSGFFQPLLLSFGVVSVSLVAFVVKRMDKVDSEPRLFSINPKIFRYAIWLIGQIAQSSFHVTKLIWGGSRDVSPSLAKIPVESLPQNKQVLYANSITLTPGTLSVDLDDQDVTVHALQASSIDALKKGDMEGKLKSIWGDKE